MTRAAEALGQHIELGGAGAARGRLHVLHTFILALERGEQRGLGAALDDFGEQRAARRQPAVKEAAAEAAASETDRQI